DDWVAVDVHVHIEVGPGSDDHLSPELRKAASRYFRDQGDLPTLDEVAEYYRQRRMKAVVFGVDSALTTGQPRIPNSHVVEGARRTPDGGSGSYRVRRMKDVIFGVDAALTTGHPRIPHGHVAWGARRHSDVLIPFTSLDPRWGADAVGDAEDLLLAGEVKGF